METTICEAKIKFTVSAKSFVLMVGGAIILIYGRIYTYKHPEANIWDLFILLIVSIMYLIAAIHQIRTLISAKGSKLILSSNNLSCTFRGSKHFLSKKSLIIPLNKVESISVSRGLRDILEGGKTIKINSGKETAYFHWVKNADEFVELTLAGMNKYKI